MKLAEALVERKAAQAKVAELGERLQRVAVVQEGQSPAEDPAALLEELSAVTGRLQRLIVAINRTNLQAMLAGGESVMAGIARRDVLKMRLGVLDNLLRACSGQQFRMRSSEICFLCTVPVADLQRQRDLLAKQYRELDAAIQAANWTTELLE
jgi:hypothetical protein